MQCELCGATTRLSLIELEGSQLKLCKNCGTHGTFLHPLKTDDELKEEIKKEQRNVKRLTQPLKEIIKILTEGFAEKIKFARERKKLTQEEFAKQINEKVSVIHNIETGKYKPSISLAEKLEKSLQIHLIEEFEEAQGTASSSLDKTMTIGDVINIKKK